MPPYGSGNPYVPLSPWKKQLDLTRQRLPNRRPSETRELQLPHATVTACVGFDPADGRPRELFLSGAKDGTEMAAILDDTSVVISVALQHGIPAAALAKSVARIPAAPLVPTDLATATGQAHTAPASVIGAALDLLLEFEAQGD